MARMNISKEEMKYANDRYHNINHIFYIASCSSYRRMRIGMLLHLSKNWKTLQMS